MTTLNNSEPHASETVRWSELLTADNAPPLFAICVAVFLHAADGLLVATMLPVIVAEIGGVSYISWIVMLYEIGTILIGVLSGALVIRHGCRIPLSIAAFTFSAGCAVNALAASMPMMLIGRLLQGLGGGGMMAMSFVAVTLLFTPRLQARAMGLISAIWACSAFLGPLFGGLFVEYATWQAAFWTLTLASTLLGLVLFKLAPGKTDTQETQTVLPLGRLLLVLAGILAVAFAGHEPSALKVVCFIGIGLSFLTAFLWIDGRLGQHRLMPKFDPLLRDAPSAMMVMVASFAAATIAIGAYAPFFLVSLHGFTPLQAGYLVAMEAVAWAGTAALISGMPQCHDRRLIVFGLCAVTISIVGLISSIASGPIWLIGVSAILQGIGFGLAWSFIPRHATRGLSNRESALASGAIPTTQRIGYAFGAAMMGLVANISGLEDGALEQAATAVFTSGLPLAVIGLVAMVQFTRTRDEESCL
ncbi:MFS transporter [uncultured Tateyamaria sp.]|uniref:MFS transporter n=1 Tax=uncultured Tateyamaria sp. TaxID=455651 RepID=UPI00261DBC8C|nr:MFS transporter [uncultured Tateyamaria sp.]